MLRSCDFNKQDMINPHPFFKCSNKILTLKNYPPPGRGVAEPRHKKPIKELSAVITSDKSSIYDMKITAKLLYNIFEGMYSVNDIKSIYIVTIYNQRRNKMIINEQGLALNSITTILTKNIEEIQKNADSSFTLHPEGVIDNLITVLAIMEYCLEQQMAYMVKQFDPKTADGEYQDALYERIGLYRKYATPSSFTVFVTGEPFGLVSAGDITLKNLSDSSFYYNKTDFSFDENGLAAVGFESLEEAFVLVTTTDTFEIVSKPENVYSIDFSSIDNIIIGSDTESDAEFRARFYNELQKPEKCTRNAVLNNLSEYTGGLKFLTVHDNNSNDDVPAGNILIIAKPLVSDAEFCQHILDNVIGGIEFIGNTTVNVPLSNGQDWSVTFQKAAPAELEISAIVKIYSGYFQGHVSKEIFDNISKYLSSDKFGLNAVIRANELIIPFIQTDGVETVTEISVKKFGDEEYLSSVVLEPDEYPLLLKSNVHLSFV